MTRHPTSTLDHLLTLQLAVAWAGEAGEEPRLGWWRTDLHSEFGGQDLFERLLPNTAPWAVLQAVREAARRTDGQQRSRSHDPDRLVTLFRFGFELDEHLDERLADLKRAGVPPEQALPGLAEVVQEDWEAEAFAEWVRAHGEPDHTASPSGRQVKTDTHAPERLAAKLVAALAPFPDAYPMPHVRT